MKNKRILWTLSGAFGAFLTLAVCAGTTSYESKMIVRSSQSDPTCASSTGDGFICAEDGIESEGILNVAGATTITGEISAVGGIDLADDADIDLGTGDDFLITFDAAAQAPDSAYIGVGTESRQLVIGETADVGTDLTIAQQTNPTLNIHSADATDANDYVTLAHDQTNGVLDVGQGIVSIPDGMTVLADDKQVCLGASTDACFEYDTAQTADALMIGVSTDSEAVIIAQLADISTDFTHADQTNPTLYIQSADAATVADFVSLAHDQTDGVIEVGAGDMKLVTPANFGVAVSPTTITESGATDVALDVAHTLNDTGAIDGSETWYGLRVTLTETDSDAWTDLFLMDLVAGSTSVLRADANGGVESNGAAIAGGTYSMTLNLGANQGFYGIQADGTAFDATANALNALYFHNNSLNHTNIAAVGAYLPTMDATGFDLGGGTVAENDHAEVFGGGLMASGRPMVVGTDQAFQFCVGVTFTDVSGSDSFFCGWRMAEIVPSVRGSYTDYAGIGHISGDFYEVDEDGDVDTQYAADDDWADLESHTLCTLVSSAGVVTYTMDGTAADTPNAQTLTDGEMVVPFCNLLHDANIAEDTLITSWAVSYTQ